MGSYEIVIGKGDGRIEIDGEGFSGNNCLTFLQKLRLGEVLKEQFKTSTPHLVHHALVTHSVTEEET
ncbi:MAG: hypothetical protein JSU72_07725 [Deltaproteobacteria bacterium]|nr:MAG: hypothetical protein JSU72_07725 [Deltaproteobacteria bacterium]